MCRTKTDQQRTKNRGLSGVCGCVDRGVRPQRPGESNFTCVLIDTAQRNTVHKFVHISVENKYSKAKSTGNMYVSKTLKINCICNELSYSFLQTLREHTQLLK